MGDCSISRNDPFSAHLGPGRPPLIDRAPCTSSWATVSRGRPWWLLVVALPFFGVTTWLAFAALAYRRHSPTLGAWAGIYALLVASILAVATYASLAAALLAPVWLAGCLHLVGAIHRAPARERWAADPDLVAAHERIERREGAKAIAVEDPVLAREAGIGQPGCSWGVLDLNHADADEIRCSLKMASDEAEKVVATRRRLGRFASLAEVAVLADLDPAAADAVYERGILL